VRILIVLLVATFGLLSEQTPLQAQFDDCDDCLFNGEFAYCLIGGGGPFVDRFQQSPDFCGFRRLCFQTEMASVTPFGGVAGGTILLGDESSTAIRSCDRSVVTRVYTRREVQAIRASIRFLSV
jgi:hypothetical protein